MKKAIFVAVVAAYGALVAAQPASIRITSSPHQLVSSTENPPARSSDANACSPVDTLVVPRFETAITSMNQDHEITILVDGKIFGTELLQLAEAPTEPARLEILRFQPAARQRLLTHIAEGAVVEAHSSALRPPTVRLAAAQDSTLTSVKAAAQIVRSIWRKTGSVSDDQTVRRMFQAQTFQECETECSQAQWDCENNYCGGAYDPQCLAYCESEYEFCRDQCPCDGFEPVLVDEYTVESTIAVSGRLAVICAGNAHSPYNQTYYDVYDFVDRTETYQVWEDCHGDQTTVLVSTVDSAVYRCHVYTGQICSSSPGTLPFCII